MNVNIELPNYAIAEAFYLWLNDIGCDVLYGELGVELEVTYEDETDEEFLVCLDETD